MEYYFETDDKLERRKYAEFLKSMLENCDKYRREDSDGAYVIAIDSPWGTGKTRFAKMLRNYLEGRTKEMGDDSLPGENASFNAIYYNSWETDFSDDALLPLVHSILESPEMELRRFDTEGKKTLKKFKKVAIDVAKIAGYTILHNVCGETVTQMAKAAEAAVTETEVDPLKRYKDRLDVLNNFKSDLQDVIAQTRQKKLVIIIDELDRCRPTFAIKR
jgi:predicted KAP-like P-loop ATPase